MAEVVHDRRSTDSLVNSRIAIDIVDDPYSSVGEKITVTRSVRDDPLADMFSRRVIDKAMYEGGRKLQRMYEIMVIGPISAIDTAKEPVDGGKMPEPITEKQRQAARDIAAVDKMLGQFGSVLMRNLLVEGMTVGQICARHNCVTARQSNFMSQRVRECLDDVSFHFGLITHRRS